MFPRENSLLNLLTGIPIKVEFYGEVHFLYCLHHHLNSLLRVMSWTNDKWEPSSANSLVFEKKLSEMLLINTWITVTHILSWWNLAQLYLTSRRPKKYMSHVTHSLSSAGNSIFSPEISKFCYIKKYRYKLHFGQ